MNGVVPRAVARILESDSRTRRAGDGWVRRCPAHDDARASLSVGIGDDDRVLLNCHAGCDFDSIVSALGMNRAEMFSEDRNGQAKRQLLASYVYQDEHNEPLYVIDRYFPKDFRSRLPDGTPKLNGTRRVLYRLPGVHKAIAEGVTVFVVEGEKDADRIRKIGRAATCNPHGAGKWRDEYSESLRGAHVVILPDNDEPGREHAHEVARSLVGKAASIKVLELPALTNKGADVSDWLDTAGNSMEELEELAFYAAEYGQILPPAGEPITVISPAAPELRKIRILTDVELEQLPTPAQLVEGILMDGSLGYMWGQPGSGKTFVAIDLLCHAGQGWAWHGHAITRKCKGVFLALERRAMLPARMRAWKSYHKIDGSAGIYFPEAIGLFDATDIDCLLRSLADLPEQPGIIVVDNYAKSILPGHENDQRDTGLFDKNIERIKAETGAAIIMLHHCNASGERERGGTVPRGSADLMIQVKEEDECNRLVCDKASELEKFQPISFRMVPHLESAVAIPAEKDCMQYLGAGLTDLQYETLNSFALVCSNGTVSTTAWLKASGVKERSFYNCKKSLHDKGYIKQSGNRWRLTELGERRIAGHGTA